MQRILSSIHLRYLLAICVTAGLMIWQSTDAVRTGSEFRDHALFWAGSVVLGWLQMILISRGLRASFGVEKYPGWALLAGSALIGALPLTFEVRWLMETIVVPEAGLPAPWVTYLNVVVINAVFCTIQYVLIERWPLSGIGESLAAELNHGAPVTNNLPKITDHGAIKTPDYVIPTIGMLSRRPEGLSGAIRYLQMGDHYLKVITESGSGIVLHRMSDAVNDLQEADGLQVHKSWWVARSAVDEIRFENRKRSIKVDDGTLIPIGRTFEKVLREAGWF